jgi:hypothetical protein
LRAIFNYREKMARELLGKLTTMRKTELLFLLIVGIAANGFALGRKPGDGDDIHPVQKGSPANPNSAYNPPSWSYTAPAEKDPTASKHAKTKTAQKPVPDSPAPAADKFPEYTAPQPTASAPPLAKDSIEPPLPDEPGGNLDKKPSFK